MSSGKNVFLFWIWHPSQIFRNYVSSHCQIWATTVVVAQRKRVPQFLTTWEARSKSKSWKKRLSTLFVGVPFSKEMNIYISITLFFCPLDARCSLYTWREKGDEFELDELKPQYANTISNLCGPDAVLYTASKKTWSTGATDERHVSTVIRVLMNSFWRA